MQLNLNKWHKPRGKSYNQYKYLLTDANLQVAPELLPFVRLFYGSPSTYCWWDAAGRCRDVCQGEGCEQGDALAPALYALGLHDALQQASDALHPDDTLVAFLDDLYVITSPSRARAALDETVRAVEDRCGIASNLGKTRVIAATAGPAPPGIAELGDDVWRGDKPDAQRGVVVLGSPVGHPAFVQGWAEERLRAEQLLLDQLPKLPDLQCAWLLLLLCASPRANHAIRTMPPSASAAYARGHDDAIWATLQTMLGGVGDREAVQARLLAALPGALGGLGLQSAQLTAPAAYWAAWADALPALHTRVPRSAASYVQLLEAELGEATHCLAEAANARRLLLDRGWSHCPTWRAILEGVRPALAANPGAGDWPHGWQYHASRTLTEHSRERLVMPSLPPSSRALLRSQAGPHAGAWLTAIPCENTTALPPQAMQVALRRRLRLALPLCASRCGPNPGCGEMVDALGDHALACPRTGLLARRAKIVERAWVRVAREAVGAEGQVVPQQGLAHTTAPDVSSDDRKRLDLVVYGGALCCDATLVSPLTRTGHPQPCTVEVDGAMLKAAERRKRSTYPELGRGPQRLVVLGSEIGGRWNDGSQRLVRDLVRQRALRAPPAVRSAAAAGWARRWWGALSVAIQLAVASTVLGRPWPAAPQQGPSDGPSLDRVLDLAANEGASRVASRLPLRP